MFCSFYCFPLHCYDFIVCMLLNIGGALPSLVVFSGSGASVSVFSPTFPFFPFGVTDIPRRSSDLLLSFSLFLPPPYLFCTPCHFCCFYPPLRPLDIGLFYFSVLLQYLLILKGLMFKTMRHHVASHSTHVTICLTSLNHHFEGTLTR